MAKSPESMVENNDRDSEINGCNKKKKSKALDINKKLPKQEIKRQQNP